MIRHDHPQGELKEPAAEEEAVKRKTTPRNSERKKADRQNGQ